MWEEFPPMYDVPDDSFGDGGITGLEGRGGEPGVFPMEDVEEDGEIALANEVVVEGADSGSSSEMKCAPSRMLRRSRLSDVEKPAVFG